MVTTSCATVTQWMATGVFCVWRSAIQCAAASRFRSSSRRMRLPGDRQAQLWRSNATSLRFGQVDDLAGTEIRCGIGHPGDAVAQQPTAYRGQAGIAALQRNRPTLVCAVEPAVRMVGRPIAARPAEFNIHTSPLRCCTRTGTAGVSTYNTVRFSGPATES